MARKDRTPEYQKAQTEITDIIFHAHFSWIEAIGVLEQVKHCFMMECSSEAMYTLIKRKEREHASK